MKSIHQTEHNHTQGNVPERNLWAAVLKMAIEDITTSRYDKRRRMESDNYKAAMKWIMSDKDDLYNSFLNVCCLLDLNPDIVRRVVRN